MAGQKVTYKLTCNARKLDRKDGPFGKSDPYVEVKYGAKLLGKSEVVEKNLNPFWKPFFIDLSECNGNLNTSVEVEVYAFFGAYRVYWAVLTVEADYDKDGTHDFIGTFSCTIQDLIQSTNKERVLINNHKGGFRSKKSGYFIVSKAEKVLQKVETAYKLQLKAKGLANKDGILGKSDPFVMVNVVKPGGHYHVVAKTEYINNNLNPTWQPFVVNVEDCKGLNGTLKIQVYDYDSDGTHDLIGEVKVTLRELLILGSKYPLIEPKKAGNLGYKNSGVLEVVSAQGCPPLQLANINKLKIQFKAKKLDDKDFIGKSDPYFMIRPKKNEVIYKSPVIKNDLNPIWPEFEVSLEQLGGLDHKFTIQIFDEDKGSKDDMIGEVYMTARHLLMYEKNPEWRVKNPSKDGGVLYRNSGILHVVSVQPLMGPAPGGPNRDGQSQPMAGASGGMPPGYGAPGGYPSQGGYPQQGGLPPGGYPPMVGAPPGAYPSQMGAYPSMGGALPGAYPSQGAYPMAPGGYPAYPQQVVYPQQGYPQQAYPMYPQQAYPQQGVPPGAYPQQGAPPAYPQQGAPQVNPQQAAEQPGTGTVKPQQPAP